MLFWYFLAGFRRDLSDFVTEKAQVTRCLRIEDLELAEGRDYCTFRKCVKSV